jgi:hypothetical protein
MKNRAATGQRTALAVSIILLCLSAAAGNLRPVSSLDSSQIPPAGGSGDSWTPVISSDGRYVLFASTANNLVLKTNSEPIPVLALPRLNVFLRDRSNSSTILVSANTSGTGGGNGDSIPVGISANARYALFESSASDLVPGDTNAVTDIFLRDLVAGATLLVSTNSHGGTANGVSRGSIMTPAGRYVAFVSAATNLVAGDTNKIPDVFVRDLQTGTTLLVSAGAMTTNSSVPVGGSESPEITPDGRYVAFYSTATNLVPGVRTVGDIYVRDLLAGTTVWASTNARALLGSTNAFSYNHAISADGQFVAFESSINPQPSGAARGILLRFNLATGFTDLINTNANVQTTAYEDVHSISMSPDGRFVAFVGNTNGISGMTTCIYLWDAQSGTSTLVSGDLSNKVQTNSTCDWPVLDPTGRYVAFLSSATNLVANPIDGSYHLYIRDMQAGATRLIAVDTNGVGSAISPATVPMLSADGRFVAFESPDAGLVPNDRNRDYDVFVRDLNGNPSELLSAHNPVLPSLTPNGPSSFSASSVSADGRFVAFASEADNLVRNDTNGCRDVFVRDRAAGTNLLVSIATNGLAPGNSISSEATISADGRYVAFSSSANNLVPGDNNKAQDVFVRDLQSGTTILASVNSSGAGPGNGASYSPILSATGKYVLFRSKASNLASGAVSGAENLFLRDLQAGTNYALTSAGVIYSAMTPDGRFVAFVDPPGSTNGTTYLWDSQLAAKVLTNVSSPGIKSIGISPDGNRIVCWAGPTAASLTITDRSANTNWVIATGFPNPRTGLHFNDDSRFLAYAVSPTLDGTNQVYLYDLQTRINLLISRSIISGGVASSNSDSPVLSGDGRFVAYRSFATDLAPGDSNALPDIFLYDRISETTTLLSHSQFGAASADNRSLNPFFSGDGKNLFFESWGSDLAKADFNHNADLFAYTLFYASVSPGLAGHGPTISWPIESGVKYNVQYKDTLDNSRWHNVSGTITTQEDQGSITDLAPSTNQRFYRVVGF